MDDSTNPLIEGEYDATDKDGFSLIDGSELDDLFVSMSEPSQGGNNVNMVDGGLNVMERLEAGKAKKNGKYNLRKSLAWDSAFFTSAGVLDAEELSSIMEGGNGGKHQHLPGIQEDVSNSTDSLSTLESDNLTLESLEADLFSDIRASIQRSGETTRSRDSNLNDRLEEISQQGKKTSEIKHGNTVKTKSTPKKINSNLQGNGKLMKVGPSREQPAGSRKEPTSCLPRPAAASAKGNTMVMAPAKVPTKRMSISAGRIKSDASHLGNEMGRVTNVSRGDQLGDPRSIIPKGASRAKSSSVSSTIPKGASHAKPSSVSSTNTRTGISSTRSSYDSIGSSSSQSSRLLPMNGIQGKPLKPASVFPPGVKSRIPSRVPLKGKNPPSNSRILAKLSAITPLSSSISPTSSISEWSSCSSTVTANQEHSASTECSSLHRTVSLDSNASQDLQIHPNQQGSCGDEGVASSANISISNPVSSKPSGLRMPSPKIGFFDGVKSGGRTQNAVGSTPSRSRLPSSRLPRSTPGNSSPGGVSNRGRIGHGTAKPTPSARQNLKSDTGRSNLRITGGVQLEGMLTAEDSNVAYNEDFTKTTSLNTSEENNSGVAKLPVGEKQLPSARKKSGFVCSFQNAIPQGKFHSPTNQVRSAVEVDHHVKEMNSLSIEPTTLHLNELINGDTGMTEPHSINMSEEVGNASKADENANTIEPNTLHLNELINGDTGKTEPHSINMSEEVGNASKADEIANTIVLCGKHEVISGKNDLDCTVINMPEEAVNASKADDNADTRAQSGGCQTDNDKNDPHSVEINTSEEAGNANNSSEFVDTVQLKKEKPINEKNDAVCVGIDMFEEVCNDENPFTGVQNEGDAATNDRLDLLCTEIKNSEEVGNAIDIDDNADTDVPSGGYEATHEKIDLLCTEINISEEVGNAVKNDDSADIVTLNGGCEGYEATHEKIDLLCTEINISEEVGNAVKNDDSADIVTLNGGCEGYEATHEKIDLLCTEINISEEVGNAVNIDDSAHIVTLNGGCEAPSENDDTICAMITDQQNAFAGKLIVEVVDNKRDGDSHSAAVSSAVELSGLKEDRNGTNLHEKADVCFSSKILESPCARTPFSDKNSSPGGLSVDLLVKRFTSLSLDNIEGKDVGTGRA